MKETRSEKSASTVETVFMSRYNYSGAPNPGNIVIPVGPHQTYFEAITPNDQGSHSAWKSFEHYKCSTSDEGDVTARTRFLDAPGNGSSLRVGEARNPWACYGSNTTWWMSAQGFLTQGLPSWYDGSKESGFTPTPSNYGNMVQDGLNRLMPIIKSELSLVNSLLELKDFKSLPRTLASVLAFSKKFILQKGVPLRKLVAHSSDVYLQKQFNIMPLLSDIAGIRAALAKHIRRVNDLVSRVGRVQRRHLSYRYSEYADSVESKTINPNGIDWNLNDSVFLRGGARLERFVWYEPTSFHVEIEYNYNFTQYQIEHARELSLLDGLGVNLNPAIIWNAIPWTFVIDWVIGVSRWLNSFAVHNMEPQINVIRYLHTVERARRILVTKEIFAPGVTPNFVSSGKVPLPVIYETTYRRQVGIPTSSSIQMSGLSLKEFSLGAALVFARRK